MSASAGQTVCNHRITEVLLGIGANEANEDVGAPEKI